MSSIVYHSVAVSVSSQTILLVVGIVGAAVMPHALFVHSWLTKNKLTTASLDEKRRLRRLHVREVILTLTIASLVNAAILVCSAAAFYPNYTGVSTIPQAYSILIPLYGYLAAVVFAITLHSLGPRILNYWDSCRSSNHGWPFRKMCEQVCSKTRDESRQRLPH